MTPATLRAAISLLTGDVKGIAGSLGYASRTSVYQMADGNTAIKPEISDRIVSMLEQRRDAIDELLHQITGPSRASD